MENPNFRVITANFWVYKFSDFLVMCIFVSLEETCSRQKVMEYTQFFIEMSLQIVLL